MDVVEKLHDTRNNFRSTLCIVHHPQIQRQMINQKRCLSNSGHGSRLPESINDWSLGAPVGNNQQNYVYFTAVWLFTVAHVCKTLGDQTIQSNENQLLQPVQNEMLYAASIAMEAPRLCPVTSNLKHPSAGTWTTSGTLPTSEPGGLQLGSHRRSWPLFEVGIWMLWVVNNVHVMWHKFKMTKFALKYLIYQHCTIIEFATLAAKILFDNTGWITAAI